MRGEYWLKSPQTVNLESAGRGVGSIPTSPTKLGEIMGTLFLLTLAFAAGLVVGWNFLPQPQFVLDQIQKLKSRLGK